MRVTQRDREVASPGRRLLAVGIDATCILGAFAATMGAVALCNGRRNDPSEGWLSGPLNRWNKCSQAPLWQRTGAARTVALRNWPSLGMHLLHIHREDARTGGPLTVHAALTRHLVEEARGSIVKELMRPWQRNLDRMRALDPEVQAARRQHPNDPQAQQQAVMEVYRPAGVSPMGGCWVALVPAVVDALVPLVTPRHQSLPEWIAGIVVVRD